MSRTPLYWTSRCGHLQVVRLLTSRGARLNHRSDVRQILLTLRVLYKHLITHTYRIVGIFWGLIFSWFSWSRGNHEIFTHKKPQVKMKATRIPRVVLRAHAQNGCGFNASHMIMKFFPRNSQNYDFHENITPQKITAIQ